MASLDAHTRTAPPEKIPEAAVQFIGHRHIPLARLNVTLISRASEREQRTDRPPPAE
jgi:hypothetical protein